MSNYSNYSILILFCLEVTIIGFSSNHEMLKAQINVRVIIKATGQKAPIILHHH
jgi:hypothetical protein